MRECHVFLAVLLVMSVHTAAHARTSDWPDVNWNPQPMGGDVILPAPCGGKVAFRKVETDTQDNWLADLPIQLGNSGIDGQEQSESLLPSSVAGSLSKGTATSRFYLIGKYEITKDQYTAVTSQICPVPSDDGSRPAEAMTWVEAQNFAQVYTEWLYENARSQLEDVAGKGAYLRLPTEAEWEFAARGGQAVGNAARRQKMFPVDGPLLDYVWHSGFKSCDGQTQPIGMLKPNPLGIFDIIGNVQEYTTDLFHLRARERMHGGTGAPVARGGSCQTGEARVRISERDEISPIDPASGKVTRKPYTGIRLLIGAPTLSDNTRIVEIADDWSDYGEMRIQLDTTDDPAKILKKIAEGQDNAEIGDALLRVSDTFQVEMARRNEIESRSAQSVVRSGYLAVRDYIMSLEFIDQVTPIVQMEPDNARMQETLSRGQERLGIVGDVLVAAIVHAAEDFSNKTLVDAHRLAADETQTRMVGMSEKTQQTTIEMMKIFVEFVTDYQEKPDTPPDVFFTRIKSYYASLKGEK